MPRLQEKTPNFWKFSGEGPQTPQWDGVYPLSHSPPAKLLGSLRRLRWLISKSSKGWVISFQNSGSAPGTKGCGSGPVVCCRYPTCDTLIALTCVAARTFHTKVLGSWQGAQQPNTTVIHVILAAHAHFTKPRLLLNSLTKQNAFLR